MSLWFITPAYQRYELSAVCFEQRKRVIDSLAARGIEAQCVVVADDGNLEIARSFDFHTVQQANDYLGRKFNDGMEYAGRLGAEWIVPIGSDSWIHPEYLLPLPREGASRTSQYYAAVEPARLAYLQVGLKNPAGPHMLHRSTFPEGFRPARDELHRYVDSSTLAGLHGLRWEIRNVHALQYIGFRQEPLLTPYERLWRAWGVAESETPWDDLKDHYPHDLVERARECLSST